MSNKKNTADSPSTVPNTDAQNVLASAGNYTGTTQKRIDLEKLLDQVDLAALAEKAGSDLRSSGRDLRGPCPLHKGKNKSAFQVSNGDDGRQYWRCYTDCNTGGDAIDFVRAWKGFDFLEAVAYLAEQAHIELPLTAVDLQQRQKRDLFKEVAQYFASNLWSARGAAARHYLSARGFTEEAIRLANIGFTDGSDGLLHHLKSLGVDLDQARELGLLRADGRDFTANAEGQNASPQGYVIFCHMLNACTTHAQHTCRPGPVPRRARCPTRTTNRATCPVRASRIGR